MIKEFWLSFNLSNILNPFLAYTFQGNFPVTKSIFCSFFSRIIIEITGTMEISFPLKTKPYLAIVSQPKGTRKLLPSYSLTT